MSQPVTESLFRPPRDPANFLIRGLKYMVWACKATPDQKKYARIFGQTQTMSADFMKKRQSTHLRALLLHAYRYVLFYRKLMEDNGITPLDIQTPADLARLPPLSRWSLERHHEDLMVRDPGKKQPSSSGESLTRDHRHRAVQAALRDRCRKNAGLYPWMRYASMGERERPESARSWVGAFASLVERSIDRRISFDLSAGRDDAFERFLEELRKHPPDHLLGSANLVSEFAHYCGRKGISDVLFERVLIEEGSLSSEDRDVVQSVFGAKVLSRYGCERIPLIAWQCSEDGGLHVNEDAMILELDPFPGSPPGYGRVLVTDLFNFKRPLIRFEMGHVAKWCEPARCPCGCLLQRIAVVEETIAESMSRIHSDLLSNKNSDGALDHKQDGWAGDWPPDMRWMN